MKFLRPVIAVILVLVSVVCICFALYPDMGGVDMGDDGECKTIFVSTMTYNGVSATARELYADTEVYNQGSYDCWYDFDSTVSTGPNGQTISVNGYVTNEDGIIPAKTSVHIGGKNNCGIWFRTGNPAGTTLNITTPKYVP